MASPQPPALSNTLQALCHGDFTQITAHLAGLQNTRAPGTALATLRPVPFVTAFRTANLRVAQVNAALPEDVSVCSLIPLSPAPSFMMIVIVIVIVTLFTKC